MNTEVLPDGVSYNIPAADVNFFKELAARMKWEIVDRAKKTVRSSSDVSTFQDNRKLKSLRMLD